MYLPKCQIIFRKRPCLGSSVFYSRTNLHAHYVMFASSNIAAAYLHIFTQKAFMYRPKFIHELIWFLFDLFLLVMQSSVRPSWWKNMKLACEQEGLSLLSLKQQTTRASSPSACMCARRNMLCAETPTYWRAPCLPTCPASASLPVSPSPTPGYDRTPSPDEKSKILTQFCISMWDDSLTINQSVCWDCWWPLAQI